MFRRRFNETDLREMPQGAQLLSEDVEPGRWIVATTHNGDRWDVIVEPQLTIQRLLVITAYRVGP